MINANIPLILSEAKIIAVVGLSDNPSRTSYQIAEELVAHGYTIIPVNPAIASWKGLTSYPDLLSLPTTPDIVNVFRKSEFVAGIVDTCIQIKAKTVWTQLGVIDEEAGLRAERAGLNVVMDRCISVELSALGRYK
jgi:uncharacterized protein